MLVRQPVVADRFYAGNPLQLRREVAGYLAAGKERRGNVSECWGVMLPHAGHVYCGQIIGATLAAASLPSRLIILCPNHTGQGRMLGVWPEGAWRTPLGDVKVDAELAEELLLANGGFEPDLASHLGEHSIEVILPFLQETVADLSVVPVAVGVRNPQILQKAGHALAQVLAKNPDAGIVVSSDMNHYADEETTLKKDEKALAQALAANPTGLLDVTAREDISMCGAPCLALALFAANELGLKNMALTAHATSGAVSGDYEHTVGYAGLLLRK